MSWTIRLKEGEREGGGDRGREGEREGWREGGGEGGRGRGKEGGREGRRKGERREIILMMIVTHNTMNTLHCVCVCLYTFDPAQHTNNRIMSSNLSGTQQSTQM